MSGFPPGKGLFFGGWRRTCPACDITFIRVIRLQGATGGKMTVDEVDAMRGGSMAGRRVKFRGLGAVLLMACAGVQVSCVGQDPSGKPTLSTLKRQMTPFSNRHPGSIEFSDRNELLILSLKPSGGHVDASEFDAEARRAGWTFEKKRQSDFWSITKYSKGRICLSLEAREDSPSEVTVSWSSNPVSWNYCNQRSTVD